MKNQYTFDETKLIHPAQRGRRSKLKESAATRDERTQQYVRDDAELVYHVQRDWWSEVKIFVPTLACLGSHACANVFTNGDSD